MALSLDNVEIRYRIGAIALAISSSASAQLDSARFVSPASASIAERRWASRLKCSSWVDPASGRPDSALISAAACD